MHVTKIYLNEMSFIFGFINTAIFTKLVIQPKILIAGKTKNPQFDDTQSTILLIFNFLYLLLNKKE